MNQTVTASQNSYYSSCTYCVVPTSLHAGSLPPFTVNLNSTLSTVTSRLSADPTMWNEPPLKDPLKAVLDEIRLSGKKGIPWDRADKVARKRHDCWELGWNLDGMLDKFCILGDDGKYRLGSLYNGGKYATADGGHVIG